VCWGERNETSRGDEVGKKKREGSWNVMSESRRGRKNKEGIWNQVCKLEKLCGGKKKEKGDFLK